MSIAAERRYYLKLKALYYYYEHDMNQQEISKLLGISRTTLSKIFAEAKEEGMIKVEIVDVRNVGELINLEVKLQEKFPSIEFHVVDCKENNTEELTQKIASESAEYLGSIIKPGMKIGIGWGRTLELVVDNLRPNRTIKGIEVVTLLGGAAGGDSRVQPNVLAQKMLEKYQGKGYIIHAPYLCHSTELSDSLKEEPHIKETMDAARQTDISIVGVGGQPSQEYCREAGYDFTIEEIEQLIALNSVGDMCANFFDVKGNSSITKISSRLIAVGLKDIKKMKKVICIGGGPSKHSAVLGALTGGYVDVLITDRFTATAVLSRI